MKRMLSAIGISIGVLIFLILISRGGFSDHFKPEKSPFADLTVAQKDSGVCYDIGSGLDIHRLVGKSVTLEGGLLPALKDGVGISCNHETVVFDDLPDTFVQELKAAGFEPYSKLEGAPIRVSGVLRFSHYECPETKPGEWSKQCPNDHYFLEQKTFQIHLLLPPVVPAKAER